ncbi:bifunctional precorrin-2 dehydrogenase/sirohydrochlorin ferrochelatase [Deinococcus sonorensis]|uniref:precorrin-2 dehydrogenase n=2 Tax=Deinococcus sonorensis TaxID=309891 RepID=A0AAU7UET6_9DEIO
MLLATFLDLSGSTAVLVGGGRVAARRSRVLLQAGLQVRVVSPTFAPEVRAQDVELMEREYRTGDLDGAALVVACTDNPEVNDRVADDARRLGLLVNHSGDAARGTFRFPATVERGGVQLALTTGTELPMLAQALRERLEAALPEQLPLERWSQQRDAALRLDPAQRQPALDRLREDIRRTVGVRA